MPFLGGNGRGGHWGLEGGMGERVWEGKMGGVEAAARM